MLSTRDYNHIWGEVSGKPCVFSLQLFFRLLVTPLLSDAMFFCSSVVEMKRKQQQKWYVYLLWLDSQFTLNASLLSLRLSVCFLQFFLLEYLNNWWKEHRSLAFFPCDASSPWKNLWWESTDWSGALGYTLLQ